MSTPPNHFPLSTFLRITGKPVDFLFTLIGLSHIHVKISFLLGRWAF
jgi:hypothetical protein